MKILKTILFTLFGLMFINAGLDKFFHYMPTPELPEETKKVFAALMVIPWILPLVGVIEFIGGLLAFFSKTRTLGAMVLLPVMVGILAQNFTVDPSGAGIGISVVLLVILLWILFDNAHKLKEIFR